MSRIYFSAGMHRNGVAPTSKLVIHRYFGCDLALKVENHFSILDFNLLTNSSCSICSVNTVNKNSKLY